MESHHHHHHAQVLAQIELWTKSEKYPVGVYFLPKKVPVHPSIPPSSIHLSFIRLSCIIHSSLIHSSIIRPSLIYLSSIVHHPPVGRGGGGSTPGAPGSVVDEAHVGTVLIPGHPGRRTLQTRPLPLLTRLWFGTGVLWCIVVYCGVLWSTVVYRGIL